MSKGCVISWHSAGSGMRGLANYGLDKDGAEIIISNCGHDITSIKRGLTYAVKKNPRVKNKACHISISLPPSTTPRTADEWRNITERTRKGLGLHDGFAYLAVRHVDTDNDHIHLIFSKISDVGKTWRDSNIRFKLGSLEQLITSEFNLPPTPADKYTTTGHINKNEIEWRNRIGELPPSIYIRNVISETSREIIDIQDYISVLADAGISVRPNLKMGELNGLGYSYDGISYTGKDIGFNWKDLKEKVIYDKCRDGETIANIKRKIDERNSARDGEFESGSSASGATNSKSDGTGNSAGTAIPCEDRPDDEIATGYRNSEQSHHNRNSAKQGIATELARRAIESKKAERRNRRGKSSVERDQVRIENFANGRLDSYRDNPHNVYRRVVLQIRLISRQLVRRLKALALAKQQNKVAAPYTTGFAISQRIRDRKNISVHVSANLKPESQSDSPVCK